MHDPSFVQPLVSNKLLLALQDARMELNVKESECLQQVQSSPQLIVLGCLVTWKLALLVPRRCYYNCFVVVHYHHCRCRGYCCCCCNGC